ncbi:hypothetical protein CEXT_540171 [Caerostris extrusa]|uniref:Uncharacterized protein n=1 Tax=Caerostris extrusa TaxID=172846 RepID=A0AAV4T6K4_CAEEX|nr:hypothetical protein CEXT_540171 [Caerostris extrusa]
MPIETKYTILTKHLSWCAQDNNHQYVQSHNVVHYQETSFSNLEQGDYPVHPSQTAPVYLSKMDQGFRIMHPNHASPSKLILQGLHSILPNMISQAPPSNLNRSTFPLYTNRNSSDPPLNSFPSQTTSRCPSKLNHQGTNSILPNMIAKDPPSNLNRSAFPVYTNRNSSDPPLNSFPSQTTSRCPSKLHHQGHLPVHINLTFPTYNSTQSNDTQTVPAFSSSSGQRHQVVSPNKTATVFPSISDQGNHTVRPPNQTASRCPSKLHHQGHLPVHLNLTFPTYNSTQSNYTQTEPAFSSSSGQRQQVVSPNKTATVFPSISDQGYHTVRPPHQNLSTTPSCFHQDYCSARPKKEVSADSSRFECYPKKKLLAKWEKTTDETLSILNNSTEASCFDQDPASIIPKKRLLNKWNHTTNEKFSKLDNSSATKPKKRLLSRWNQHTVETFSNLNDSTEVTRFDQDPVSIIPKKRLLNKWNQTTNEAFPKLDNSSATNPKKSLLSRWNQHTVETFSNLNDSTEVSCFDQDPASIILKNRLLNRWNQTTNIFLAE